MECSREGRQMAAVNDSEKGMPDTPRPGRALWDPRKVLEYPPIYNFFQKLVGADKPRRKFIAEITAPLKTGRILEVGCGPGTNCEWIPRSFEYVGCDLSESYIAYARKNFGDRAEFFLVPVGQLASLGLRRFNVVIAIALLHHLSDSEVLTLCDEVLPLLESGGMFVTGDPCFVAGQNRLEHFIISCDRGRYLRYPEHYRELLAKKFPVVEMEVSRAEGMLIPNTGVRLTAHAG
jgi:SAM-dependent methyltransferase